MQPALAKSFYQSVDAFIDKQLPRLEQVYKDLHAHPELSMQEKRTAKIAAAHLGKYPYKVTTGVGGTGVVGVLKNGDGPVVMLRADMDALPVTEATKLPYASKVKARDARGSETGVAHACGHDLHVTWLMGAASVFAEHRHQWSGTLLLVFQPGEEVGRGAQAMIDDGLMKRFPKPDIILGQHVMVGEAGTVGHRAGAILSAGDSMQVKLFGRGAHGSFPELSIDPVVMAAATALRLQTIVSREVAPAAHAVVTIGALQAGTKENIIPDEATLKLNVRTFDEGVRDHVLAAVKRICCAECAASNAPRLPEFTALDSYPVTENDAQATAKLAEVFQACFGKRAFETAPASASEDFSVFGRSWKVPYVFWFIGGTDPATYRKAVKKRTLNALPANHSPLYAPVIHPTLKTGLQAMVSAAAAWLNAR